MDNGALVFIIVFEAIAIVWLASKLKHYQKFEHLLSDNNHPQGSVAGHSAAATQSAGAAHSSSAGGGASLAASTDTLKDDLLEAPGAVSDDNIEEAKKVQLVMARCQYAEFYLEQLDDDYERGQFKHIIENCMATARRISDSFFKASALHPIILLLDRAGWEDSRNSLLSEVADDNVRLQINHEIAEQNKQEV